MGKRQARSKPAPKNKEKLDTTFRCPFCNHCDSVECTIFYKESLGEAKCYACSVSYSTNVTHLTHAIDIYSEWIDTCETANYHEDA
ncbi:hypothetical protein RJ640_026173 [Escallonia rubra]|uniref:Transcription elongation factor 1 homolog n=1 Tax=Escallonia rubra TaxID=112253 RepID=A0AA88URH4_9ASTE|nr:hypothetical protein RJ640_026173 [Escallonia rubra]